MQPENSQRSTQFNAADVQHDEVQQQFYIFRDGLKAVLAYQLLERHGQQVVDFYHTLVPTEWRGCGVAALLTDEGLRVANAEQWQITASCSYVAARLQKAQ